MARMILPILSGMMVAATVFGQAAPPASKNDALEAEAAAPPEVDTALRARVNLFYKLEVEQKFSQALALVAEDTKDLFIGSSKPTYRSFEIQRIHYYDNFTKAEILALVTRLLPIEGFMGHPLPTRMTSRWKLENGEWCFFVDPMKDLPSSPFGRSMPPRMTGAGLPGGIPGAGLPGGMPASVPATPRQQPPMPANIPPPGVLAADKMDVQLKASSPSEAQVTISNPSPWTATLLLIDPKVAGVIVKLDHTSIDPSKKAILTIRSNGKVQVPKTPVTVVVNVQRTNQVIPVRVRFE